MAAPTTTLLDLVNLVKESIDTIENSYLTAGEPAPSLDDVSGHVPKVALSPEVLRATATLTAACSQLTATVRMPAVQIMQPASGHYLSSTIQLVIQAHVAEALRPAGPQGLHVNEIAKFSIINPDKLARCLRTLASSYVFKEVAPNVFANNKLSVMLDTGKNAADLAKEGPETWFEGTDGRAAFLAYMTGLNYKFAGCVPEVLLDPRTADSYSPAEAAFYKAVPGEGYASFFDFLTRPGQEAGRSCFNMGMVGTEMLEMPDFVLHEGIGWDKLPEGSTVVDVGGGVGAQMLKLARVHPHLKLIVQDLPRQIEDAKAFWQHHEPKPVEEGRVTLQEHNFFNENPIKGADVYFLREIIHNWPDKEAQTILRNVRDAADEKSQIIVVCHVIQLATRMPPEAEGSAMATLSGQGAPEPLLPNFGPASERAYYLDMCMLNQMNAVERTTIQWADFAAQAGVKIDRVVGDNANGDLVHIICSKVV